MDKSMFKLLAILGGLILLLVVVVFLSNLGNGNKKYSYDELTSEAVKATKKYLSDNSSRKPNRTNQKSTIMLQTLVEENYLKEPADMLKDEDANCYGEINVYYLDEKKYDYIPDIKCTIRNERYYSKNLVNALIGNAEYTDMNVVFIGSGLYKRINNKWIDKDEDLSNFGNDDIVEYYYRGNQEALLKNYVQIDDNLWRIVQCIEQRRCISIRYIKMDRTEVIRKLHPSAVMFSEYYFYLIAYEPDGEPTKAKYYRIDRIRSIIEHREKFSLDKSNNFDEGELREKNQFMFPGDLVQITFEFSGLSLQSVLDRLPTARVIEKNGKKSIVTAEVNYGRGLIMYLLSQGSWIKVLSPQPLIDDMKGEIQKMAQNYE